METTEHYTIKKKGEINTRLLLTIATAIVLFLLLKIYFKNISPRYDEEIAFVAMVILVGGTFAGRFISQLWIRTNHEVPAWILILLPLVMTGCTFLIAVFTNSLLRHPVFMYGLFLGLPSFIFCLSLGIFVKLLRTRINRQLLEARAAAANSQGELQLLQSQLSPHFLFNTLNNLYGLSITHHERLPQLLLKLSELLRYSVYETRAMWVPLKDELAYIGNYIEFEKIRIGDRLVLNMAIEQVADINLKIAPMLLIVFVENAFKHSKNSGEEKIYIDIALRTWEGFLLLSVKNSYSQGFDNKEFEGSSGMGLANVKKRLELLYPGAYDLVIESNEPVYNVMLRLKIK